MSENPSNARRMESQGDKKKTDYRPPRLHVAGKATEILKGGNAGSLEDFAKRFKSAESG